MMESLQGWGTLMWLSFPVTIKQSHGLFPRVPEIEKMHKIAAEELYPPVFADGGCQYFCSAQAYFTKLIGPFPDQTQMVFLIILFFPPVCQFHMTCAFHDSAQPSGQQSPRSQIYYLWHYRGGRKIHFSLPSNNIVIITIFNHFVTAQVRCLMWLSKWQGQSWVAHLFIQ